METNKMTEIKQPHSCNQSAEVLICLFFKLLMPRYILSGTVSGAPVKLRVFYIFWEISMHRRFYLARGMLLHLQRSVVKDLKDLQLILCYCRFNWSWPMSIFFTAFIKLIGSVGSSKNSISLLSFLYYDDVICDINLLSFF